MRTLLIVALIAPLCPAADLTGTWFGEVKWNGADHPQDVCISLWTGKGVSGVITLDGRDSLDISSGHLEDDRIDFASGATSFHLNNLGDQLTGAAQTDSRQGSVSLERLNPMRGGSPVPIRRPNPEYTPEARAARLEGTSSWISKSCPPAPWPIRLKSYAVSVWASTKKPSKPQ